jgi:hypothetical protein
MPVPATRLKIVVESLVLKELLIGVQIELVKEPNVLLAVPSVFLLVAASLFVSLFVSLFANRFVNQPASLLSSRIAWPLLLQLHPSRMKPLQQPCRTRPLVVAMKSDLN